MFTLGADETMSTEQDLLAQIKQLKDEKNKLIDLMQKERTEKSKRHPADFVQVSRQSMKDIRVLADKNKLSLKILMIIAEKMNKQNAVVISQKTLCQIVGKGRTSVYNAVKVLEEGRWLKTLKIGTANAYIVNEKVFWSDLTDKRRYAIFSASVIVSEDEQELSAEDWDAIETKHFPFLGTKTPILIGNDELLPPDQTDLDLM